MDACLRKAGYMKDRRAPRDGSFARQSYYLTDYYESKFCNVCSSDLTEMLTCAKCDGNNE